MYNYSCRSRAFSQVICGVFSMGTCFCIKKSSANFCDRNKWLGLFHRHLGKSYSQVANIWKHIMIKLYHLIYSKSFRLLKSGTYELDSEWTKIISPTYQKKNYILKITPDKKKGNWSTKYSNIIIHASGVGSKLKVVYLLPPGSDAYARINDASNHSCT